MTDAGPRDHGGGVDAAVRRWGGQRSDWLDLSTGINPVPYPVEGITPEDWTTLPDHAAREGLLTAARSFWQVPDDKAILTAPGASALIAALPGLGLCQRVEIPGPTYNEHAAAFGAAGIGEGTGPAAGFVAVHPNNPDGRRWRVSDLPKGRPLTVIDESFCDVTPEASLVSAADPQTIVLKSFGKFWGLAGLRLGFAIGAPDLIARLSERLGPWAVSGPALRIGRVALSDPGWAARARGRLARDAQRLDRIATARGQVRLVGGTPLFRLYHVKDAEKLQANFASHRILCRIFPYSRNWIRLGLPGTAADWERLETALA